ncbi:hypothetical protein [Halolamina sediminis]|uniref:hypothetical protein n=1 Tax=Halolamina sediminis TaxID=1480675 RepID=UPI0006B57011|nr:hypothetical protein [Halolamina sediminis]
MGVTHTPDVLVGLGGGGGDVVARLLRQDWLLDDVLNADVGDEPGKLRASIVDSAIREEHPTTAIDERIAAAKDRADHPNEATLSFEGRVVVPEHLPDRWFPLGIAPGTVKNICQREGLHSWWLANDRDPLESALNHGFTNGTFRRRPLGKALYHIATYLDVPLVPPTTNTDEVAFVTTLGGGTGSGMALDLAAGVDSRRTHLYAILPHEGAIAEEKANAFAALSELAYAHHAGESPFDTVTLLPHLDGVDARTFEMAAVRSILAHQQAVQGGPAPWNAGPNSEPFTVAAPYTVEFPVEHRRAATEAVHELFTAKQMELEIEADLHAHVRTYLRECFPNTAGAALTDASSLDPAEHASSLFELRHRIEAGLRERLLDSDALDAVGTVHQVEELRATVDDSLEHVRSQLDADDETERARQYVETAPELLIGSLDAEAWEFDPDTVPDKLRRTLVAELENVAERRELLDAVARITPEEAGIDEADARLVRELLAVALDSEAVYPARTPTADERIAAVAAEIDQLEDEREVIESLHEEIATDLRDRLDRVFAESGEAASVLTAVNEHREGVVVEIDDLEATIADAVATLEAASTAEAAASVTLDLGEFESLNPRLSEMGVIPLPLGEVEAAFDRLREARVAFIDYRAGFLSSLFRRDRAGEYEDHITAIAETAWFDVEPLTVTGEAAFRIEFSPEPLRREDEIAARHDDAVENVVDAFTALFGGADPPQFERTVGESTHVSVPEPTEPETEAGLRDALKRSDAEDVDTLFESLFPTEELHAIERTTQPDAAPAATLYDAYLSPVRTTYRRTVDRLHALTGGDGDELTGTLDRLELLRELTVGESASAELPNPDPHTEGQAVTGAEFAQRYEGRYEPEFDPGIDLRGADNPYVSRKLIEWDGPVTNPAAIDETALVGEQLDAVTRRFADFTDRMLDADERAPIASLHDDGSGGGSLDASTVFLSPGAPPGSDNLEAVEEAISERVQAVPIGGQYATTAYATEHPTAVTAATFFDGLALDDLELVGGPDGYRSVYERERNNGAFPGAFHAIGLGGDWATWETLGEWVATADADDCGGYVYRDTLLDDAEAEGSWPDLFSAGVTESTVPLD